MEVVLWLTDKALSAKMRQPGKGLCQREIWRFWLGLLYVIGDLEKTFHKSRKLDLVTDGLPIRLTKTSSSAIWLASRLRRFGGKTGRHDGCAHAKYSRGKVCAL